MDKPATRQFAIGVDASMPDPDHPPRSNHSARADGRLDAARHRPCAALPRTHHSSSHPTHPEGMSLLALLHQIRSGNSAAFEPLIDAVTPQLRTYQRWARTAADAADLRQELLLALWVALRFHPPRVVSGPGQDLKERDEPYSKGSELFSKK